MTKERLDVLLVKQGMVESREKARALIMAGNVYINNQKADKAGTMVKEDAVIRVDGVRIPTFQLFVRAVLGKYTIETMVPLFIIMLFLMGTLGITGPIVILLLIVLQIVVMVVSKTNSPIHDLLAVTVVVDINTQMIFDSTAEMIEYKKKRAEEQALAKPY